RAAPSFTPARAASCPVGRACRQTRPARQRRFLHFQILPDAGLQPRPGSRPPECRHVVLTLDARAGSVERRVQAVSGIAVQRHCRFARLLDDSAPTFLVRQIVDKATGTRLAGVEAEALAQYAQRL